MRRYLFPVAGLALLGLAMPATAYETLTHDNLTTRAAAKSKLATDPSLLRDLGFKAWSDTSAAYLMSPGIVPTISPSASSAIVAGAIWEDDQYKTRAFNHFFDVQADRYSGRGLYQLGSLLGHTSPDWILEDTGLSTDLFQHEQEFSFRRAQQQLYSALTASDPSTRHAAFSATLQMLGHVVHHIQDMAQPQHVRNDQHTHPIPLTGNNPGWSYYERYTQYSQEAVVAAALDYPIPSFGTARQFWYTVPRTDDPTEYFTGMAEFTAKNFVSYNTQYVSSPTSFPSIGPNEDLPLPNGLNRNGSRKYVGEPVDEVVRLTDGSTYSGRVQYLYGDVFDGNTGGTTFKLRLASASALNDFLIFKRTAGKLKFTENTAVYNDGYKVLLPRAVAFSTGLINHLFRGRVNLRQGSGDTWLVDNKGTQSMSGLLTLFAEDSNGKRAAIPGTLTKVDLAPNQSQSVTVKAPSGTKNLVAAFQGRIGNEGDATLASGFWAAAGQVTPYSAPVVPCGVPINAGGSSLGLNLDQELGLTAGKVQVKFEAYSIPDRLDITTPGGATLLSTNGLVSGTQTLSFNHNPGSTGSTKVHLRVTGNSDPGTAWTLAVSCPNQNLPGPQTIRVVFGIDPAVTTCNFGLCPPPACPGNWTLVLETFAGNIISSYGIRDMIQGKPYSYNLKWNSTGPSGTLGCSSSTPYYIDTFGKHPLRPGAGTLLIQQYGGGGAG